MLEVLTPWMTPAIVVGTLVFMRRAMREDMKQMESRLESEWIGWSRGCVRT